MPSSKSVRTDTLRSSPHTRRRGERGPAPDSVAPCRSRLAQFCLCLAIGLLLPLSQAGAGNLVSIDELALVRDLADRNVKPQVDQRAALLSAAQREWRWGSVSGEFVTTLDGTKKRCHPASNANQINYLKEGAPDAYARVLGFLSVTEPKRALAEEARTHVLDLVDTTGFHGLGGQDQSAANQCALELGLSIPVWIETAALLEYTPVWSSSDKLAFAGWLASEVYPRVAWASRARRNNWGAAGSAAASLIADYVDGFVPALAELWPEQRWLTPEAARTAHDAIQLDRIGTTWRGDSRCARAGIQSHGGIPDELRRGAAGCDALFLPSGDDSSLIYQTMHVELLVLHAEAQRRRGQTTLFDAVGQGEGPAILRAILFVIDNPSPNGLSWPWGSRSGALATAYRYYGDARLARELDRSQSESARGGRTLPYAKLLPMRPIPPVIVLE